MSWIIGVDVGGTNTDGVILSEGKVLVSEKTTTTEDVGEKMAIFI